MAEASPLHRRRSDCRACGAPLGAPVLSLGRQPLANELLPPGSVAERFPLDLAVCPSCGLAQLIDDIRPERLFEGYRYVTGASSSLSAHFARYAQAVAAALGGRGRALEIGCNDGALLGILQGLGVSCLGVEPAAGPASWARARGLEILEGFFGASLVAEALADRGPFDAIIANNVLAHVDAPGAVLRAFRSLLAPGGRVVLEFPGALALLNGGLWDTLYHEHRSYLSLTALTPMAGAADLQILRVEAQPVHGGSLRVWLGGGGEGGGEADAGAPLVQAQLEAESRGGIGGREPWEALGARVVRESEALRTFLGDRPGRVLGYGAPAKATVRLNAAGVGVDLLPFTVDRNPEKIGLCIPGVSVPIRPVRALEAAAPEVVLVFPWNLLDEIRGQVGGRLPPGARFVPATLLGSP